MKEFQTKIEKCHLVKKYRTHEDHSDFTKLAQARRHVTKTAGI